MWHVRVRGRGKRIARGRRRGGDEREETHESAAALSKPPMDCRLNASTTSFTFSACTSAGARVRRSGSSRAKVSPLVLRGPAVWLQQRWATRARCKDRN